MISEIVGWDTMLLRCSLVFPRIARRAAPIAAPYSPSIGLAMAVFKVVAIVSNQNRDRLPPPIANNWSGQGPAFSTPLGNRVMQMRPPRKVNFEGVFGYTYFQPIEHADKIYDFDFLLTNFGSPVHEPEIN